jgi:hypothetical protein
VVFVVSGSRSAWPWFGSKWPRYRGLWEVVLMREGAEVGGVL